MTLRVPKANNRSFIKTGGLKIQPKHSIVYKSVVEESKQNKLSQQSILKTTNELVENSQQLYQDIQTNSKNDNIINDKPSQSQKEKKISSLVISNIPKETSKFDVKKDSTTTSNLTENKLPENVIQIRPDILMLSKFTPLFLDSGEKSEQGNLFDVFVESLRQVDSKNIELLNNIDKSLVQEKNAKLKSEITTLRESLNKISLFTKFIFNSSKLLNLFDEVYEYSPQIFVDKNFGSSTLIKKNSLNKVLGKLNSKLNLSKSLEIALDEKNVAKDYNGTKLWMVSINELKELINSHSLALLSPKTPLENKNEIFGSGFNLPDLKSSLRISPSAISNMNIPLGYDTENYKRFKDLDLMLSNVKSSESMIALIFYIISKELSHRQCLSKRKMSLNFSDRQTLIDNLFGNYSISHSIFERIEPFSGTKLSDICYFRDLKSVNKTVFTFEKVKIPGSNSTFGDDYFFDGFDNSENLLLNVLKADKVNDFKIFLENLEKSLFDLMSNVALIPYTSSNEVFDLTLYYNPIEFFNSFLSNFVVISGSNSGIFKFKSKINTLESNQIEDSDISALLAYASNGNEQSLKLRNELYNFVYSYSASSVSSATEVSSKIIEILKSVSEKTNPKSLVEKNLFKNPKIKFIQTQNVEMFTTSNISNSLLNSEILKSISLIILFLKSSNVEFLCPIFFTCVCKLFNLISNSKIQSIHYTDPQLAILIDEKLENHLDVKSNINSKIENELVSFYSLSFSVLNSISTLKSGFQTLFDKIIEFDNSTIDYLLRYLNNDITKLSVLFREPQLNIVLSFVEDLYKSFQEYSTQNQSTSKLFINNFEGLSYSTKIIDSLQYLFKSPEHRFTQGYNKQIISVGIPQGLFRNLFNKSLNNKPKVAKNNTLKYSDLFKVCIYKIDILNDEIVYFPKKFLFDSSRFPVKVNSLIKPISRIQDDNKLISSIPTRSYSLFENKNNFIQEKYWEKNSFDEEYSFLSDREKKEIITNHVNSFLLECYIDLMSGLKVNDSSITLSSSSEIKLIYDELIKSEIVTEIKKDTKNYRQPTNAVLTIPDPNPYISSYLQPKKYDRVYNIMFDPEFVVDYQLSRKTKIQELLKERKLLQPISNNPEYLVDSNKSFLDTSMNTYFITVESYEIK